MFNHISKSNWEHNKAFSHPFHFRSERKKSISRHLALQTLSLAFHVVFEAASCNLSMLCPSYPFLYQAFSDSKNQCVILGLIVVKRTVVKLCHFLQTDNSNMF